MRYREQRVMDLWSAGTLWQIYSDNTAPISNLFPFWVHLHCGNTTTSLWLSPLCTHLWTQSKADLKDISSKDCSSSCFSADRIVSSLLQNFSSFISFSSSFQHSPLFFLCVISCSLCLVSLRCVTTFYPRFILTSFNSTVLFSGHMTVYCEERIYF